MRAVLDPNVLISALLSVNGSPARVLLAWQQGAFELIVSPMLLAETARALAYPKLSRLVPSVDAEAFVAWLGRSAILVSDPAEPPVTRSVDPGDDYLLALAAAQHALLVSGDRDLLALADGRPIHSPAGFLALLAGATR